MGVLFRPLMILAPLPLSAPSVLILANFEAQE